MAEANPGRAGHENEQPRDIVNPVDDRIRVIKKYTTLRFTEFDLRVVRFEVQAQLQAQHFELKPVMFQMLQSLGQYGGQATEDPHLHLRSFLEICDNFKLQGVTREALIMRLFLFSLRESAKTWLTNLPPGSVTTWNELAETFLLKYFPPTMIARCKNAIMSFKQEDELVSEAWERYKELLRRCLNHGIPYCIQIEIFYNGLSGNSRMVIDATVGGGLLDKTFNEAYEILYKVAPNNYFWSNSREATIFTLKVTGVLEIDNMKALTAQMEALGAMISSYFH